MRFGRLREIAEGALLGQPFHCHKTVYGPGVGRRPRSRWVECAGVIEWRDRILRRWPSLGSHVLRKLVAAVERDAADRRRRRASRRRGGKATDSSS